MPTNDHPALEFCLICGCPVHRRGDYAKPTVMGRSHATRHHFIAERFFGRSANRPGSQREPIFEQSPWQELEGKTAIFCYDCHEELLHNPIFLPEDVAGFAELARRRNLDEAEKTDRRDKLAGLILLLHEVIEIGIKEMLKDKVNE